MIRNIIIYYNKREKHSGVPITVRVGDAAIQCKTLTLDNIAGRVAYSPDKSLGYSKRYGVTCPLIIPILEEPPSKRALKERERYRKKHHGQ